MNFDLHNIPTTFDMVHIGLAVLALLFFILFLVKGSGGSPQAVDSSTTAADDNPSEAAAETEAPVPAELKEATPDAALQLLSLLQQEARFIDFVKEDLSGFSDEDIGAAARVVHEGSQKALDSYFTLEPVRSEDEESQVTLEAGFDASAVRLTGNVVGEAPFNGVLVHRGWKASDIRLPKLASNHDASIVAPAEVEL